MSASVGIATSAHADSAEALLRDADVAMYRSKALGRGRYLAFEPAMHAAALLGRGFSVVTTLGRTVGRAEDLALLYGVERSCLGVHACEIPVLDLGTDPNAFAAIVESCRAAVASDGCDAIVLGCAGMADLCARIGAAVAFSIACDMARRALLLGSSRAHNRLNLSHAALQRAHPSAGHPLRPAPAVRRCRQADERSSVGAPQPLIRPSATFSPLARGEGYCGEASPQPADLRLAD